MKKTLQEIRNNSMLAESIFECGQKGEGKLSNELIDAFYEAIEEIQYQTNRILEERNMYENSQRNSAN